jgi:hypothetical protein
LPQKRGIEPREQGGEAAVIRIICYEDPDAWIFGKFARKLHNALLLFGKTSETARQGGQGARIAHHIAYGHPPEQPAAPVETFMITHLDTAAKLARVKRLLQAYPMGICMSEEHRNTLARTGLPEERLCYVNPAQDGVIRPRAVVLGIASKTHPDGRKKEQHVVEALRHFPPGAFRLKIMGGGWDAQVAALRAEGHRVEYRDAFDYDIYTRDFMPSLDYFVYFSHDEGSMAYLDAIAADVKTIVTAQGFHLDIFGGMDHVITGVEDLRRVLSGIHDERQRRAARVAGWTWPEYAFRHLVIWDYLKGLSATDVAAEGRAFFRLLPKLLEQKAGLALKRELTAGVLPSCEALRQATALASGRASLHALAAHWLKQALVFHPKNPELRAEVLQAYPECVPHVPSATNYTGYTME